MLPFIGLFTAKLNLPEQQLVQSIQVTITRQHHRTRVPCILIAFTYICLWMKKLTLSTLTQYMRGMFLIGGRSGNQFFDGLYWDTDWPGTFLWGFLERKKMRKYWDTDRLTEHFIVRIFRKDTDDESREQTYTAQFWNMKEKCKWTWWNFIVCIYFAEAYQKSLCFRLFSCGCCTLMVLLIKVDILFSNLSDCLPEI